jgi:beta-lactamase regulating signal transducer with metallopeptidase domain
MTWLLSLVLKSTAVLAMALAVAAALRRSSSSARHTVWALALTGLLIFPVLGHVLPRWEVPVLPPPSAAPAALSPSSTGSIASFEAEPLIPSHELEPSAPVEMPMAPSARRWIWRDAVIPVWLFGVAFGLAQLSLGTLVIALTVRRARRVSDGGWRTLLADACACLGLARAVDLRETGAVSLPVVWGYRRPVILLPRDAADWPIDRRRAFLLHELSHVARYDCFTQTLAYVVRALYWPHPLVWWAVASLRREAERACDDRVVAAGTEAPEYAQHLLEAARSLPRAPRTLATASAVIERTSLGDRLLALLDERLERGTVTTRALAVTASAALVAVAVVAVFQPVTRAAVVETIHAAVTAAAPAAATPTPAPSAAPSRPTPRPSASTLALTGAVKGPDGKPIEKALVVVRGPGRGLGIAGRVEAVRTDAAGLFRVEAFAGAGPYQLTAEASPLAVRTLPAVRPGAPIAVVLEKGVSLAGTVRDAATRRPITRAVVSVTVAAGVAVDRDAGRVTATTDASGRYRLDGLPAGAHTLVAAAPGYMDESQRVQGDVTPPDFFLRAGGASIVGVAKSPDGKPIVGARVTADGELPIGSPVVRPVTTDDAGRFQLTGMEDGTYRLLVWHPEWAPQFVPAITAGAGPANAVQITMARPYRITGRLVADADQPAPGFVMVQALDGVDLPRALTEEWTADTDRNGRFFLDGVAAGAFTLAVRPVRFAPSHAEIVVAGKDRVIDAGDIRVELGHVIRGRVRNNAGAPVENARVYVPASSDPGDTVTGPDGTFVMAGVKAGSQGIAVHADGYAQDERRVEADGPPIDVVLQPGSGITGVLVDAARRPVIGAMVMGRGGSAGGSIPRFIRARDLTKSDGRFEIEDVPPGEYDLEVQPREHLDKDIPDVKVEVGRQTDVGRVVLDAGASVAGLVVDAAGAPVPGAVVSFEDATQRHRSNNYGQVQRPTTSAEGRFVLKGLTKGVAKLSASHRLYASSLPVDVDVDPEIPVEARLTLLEGARVVGAARTRDGAPVARAFVVVSGAGLRGNERSRSPIAADGTFSVERITPGQARVVLMEGSAGTYKHVMEKVVDLRDGETATVNLDLLDVLVSGRLTRGAKPLGQHRVHLSDGTGGAMYVSSRAGVPAAPSIPRGEAETRPDGTYTLIVPRPGKYEVRVTSIHGSGRVAMPKLDDVMVPDAARFHHDIVLPDWSLTGRVTASDTKKPIERARVSAQPSSGEPGGAWAHTSADGRFQLALDPGRYRVLVRAPSYVEEESTFDSAAAAGERSFELTPGASIKGAIVDAAGRKGRPGAVVAVASNGRSLRWVETERDGEFVLDGLIPGPHVLFANDSERPEFALLPGVSPGDASVSMVLAPGARARLAFKDAAGKPLAAVSVRLDLVGLGGTPLGIEGRSAMSQTVKTDAAGIAEYRLPSGAVDVIAAVAELRLRGEAKLSVPAGVPFDAAIQMRPRP